MSEKIKYSLNVQVVGGVSLPIMGEMTPEAYGKIQIVVAAGASDMEVNLQADGANLAELLLIKSSSYDSKLTYKVNQAAASAISLDGPHVFIGRGAVGILDSAPTKLFFSNDLVFRQS